MGWHFFPQKLSERRRNFGKPAYERPIIATQPQKRPNLLNVLGLREILYGRYFIVHSVDSISIYSVPQKGYFLLQKFTFSQLCLQSRFFKFKQHSLQLGKVAVAILAAND